MTSKLFKGSWAQRNREKVSAQRKVHAAVKRGDLVRPSVCERCGTDKGQGLHGHHDDYSKPLEVMWLCPLCHRRRHDQLRLAATGLRWTHWRKRYPADQIVFVPKSAQAEAAA